jgi:hypothetical protein
MLDNVSFGVFLFPTIVGKTMGKVGVPLRLAYYLNPALTLTIN